MNNICNKKAWSALIVLLFAIMLGAGAWYLFFRIDRRLIGDAIVLRRVTLEGQLTENAHISIPYLRDSDDYALINIAVDFNKDGRIYPYQLEDGRTQEEWIVKDLPPRVLTEEGASYSFALADLSVEERFDFSVKVMLSNKTAPEGESGTWLGSFQRRSAAKEAIIAAIEHDEVRPRFYPDPEGIRTGGFPFDLFVSSVNAQEMEPGLLPERPSQGDLEKRDAAGKLNDTVLVFASGDAELTGSGETEMTPEADSERIAPDAGRFNVFHGTDMPDYPQGRNECVPVSAANSLQWLAKRGKFEDKLPPTLPELVQELKTAFHWTENGVNVPKDFLDGKHAIVERRELPIETHQVGDRFDENIVAKIAEELRKGQDVEVEFEYGVYDGPGFTNWRRTGGHMVTAVGASKFGDTTLLDIHDPLSPGPRKLDIYKVRGSLVENYRYQGRSYTYIRYAIAESPALNRRTQRWLTPTSTPGGAGGEAIPGGGEVTPSGVTLGGGPFTFDHKIGGTACPTPIGTLNIKAPAGTSWQVSSATVPGWLSITQKAGKGDANPKLSFNCQLKSYVTQDVEANVEITAKDASGNPVGSPQTVNIKGHIEK